MKFKFSGIIETKPLKDYPEWLVVKQGCHRYLKGERLSLEYLIENGFTAVDSEALMAVDPDRTERLCPAII